MEFYIRYSTAFIINLALIFLALVMAFLSFFASFSGEGLLKYLYLIWMLVAFVRYISYKKYLYLKFNRRPALVVTTDYILDTANDIKYFWKDIDGSDVTGSLLYLWMKNPVRYINFITNPYRRFRASRMIKSNKDTPFAINTDVLTIDSGQLQEIIVNFMKRTGKQADAVAS
ncbi:MAG TPA: STM3941 family protein [Mucilaginibacter sp.]|nr:STM3941 family protein [Mucilaginibacter sp.]